jgi:uncharacterized protein YbaP (TraB family)
MKSMLGALVAVMMAWGCASTPPQATAPGPALFVARDADSTLYLYGTIHLRRTGAPWGSPAVEAALRESDEIWTEMEISPQSDALTQQLALQLGIAPAGRGLSTWLTPEETQRFSETALRLGLQAQMLEPMQPWLASLTLTIFPMMRAGYDPQAGVDRAIDAFGDANGKRMRAFETPRQQIGFFADFPPEIQRQMLIEAINEAGQGAEVLDQMSATWERGDLDALERLLSEDMRRAYPEMYAALISNRNAAWIVVLMGELEGEGVDFVAVGAAHLVGEEGLIAQLRARGVSVERVSPAG